MGKNIKKEEDKADPALSKRNISNKSKDIKKSESETQSKEKIRVKKAKEAPLDDQAVPKGPITVGNQGSFAIGGSSIASSANSAIIQ